MTSTPVLITAYRRHDRLRERLDWVVANGLNAFVHIDGPKNSNETVEYLKVIDTAKQYESHIANLYVQNHNLGCYKGMFFAISWAFRDTEKLIIVEDDIEISSDFLPFSERVLNQFAEVETVCSVAATNLVPKEFCSTTNARLSLYPSSWGWATWRNRWTEFMHNPSLGRLLSTRPRESYWTIQKIAFWVHLHRTLNQGQIDSWATRWAMTNLILGRQTVTPNFNLALNSGFGDRATHTKSNTRPFWLPDKLESVPKIPEGLVEDIQYDKQADMWMEKNHFQMTSRTILWILKNYLNNKR